MLKIRRYLAMWLALLFIAVSNPVFSLELKSNEPAKSSPTKLVDEIKCEFTALSENKKQIKLKTEVFKTKDLLASHDDGTAGVYVNVFDFLGFSFSMNQKKQLIIESEREETKKKIKQVYSNLPMALKTKTEFSVKENNKSISVKEVQIVCKP